MTRRYDYTSESDKRGLYDKQCEKCFVSTCRAPLHWAKPRNWIVEHESQLSISGDNSLANKTLRCKACARKKTNGTKATSYGSDAHARGKIRRIRGENKPKMKRPIPSRPMGVGKTQWPTRKIESRGFQKRKTPCPWKSQRPCLKP